MTISKTYLLFEIIKQLKEKYNLTTDEIQKRLLDIYSKEPRYLIIASGKTIKLSEK